MIEVNINRTGIQSLVSGLDIYRRDWEEVHAGVCLDAPEYLPAGSTRFQDGFKSLGAASVGRSILRGY